MRAGAALVLGRDPDPHGDLAAHLGAERLARLHELLVSRAANWAQEVAPGRSAVVLDPDAAREAVREAFEHHGGPVLFAGTGVPRLRREHALAALADLAAGADASFGPGMGGGLYLVALAAPRDDLLELAAEVAGVAGQDVMPRTLAAAQSLDLDVGLLRMERVLAGAVDARAMAADPLTPDDIRALLIG